MKIKILDIIAACAFLLTAFFDFEMNKSFQEENHFILHYTIGPAWEHGKPPNEQAFFAEHSRFLSSLRSSGRAKIGGRYSDKGMILFSAIDRSQADSLLSTDPSIPNGTFHAKVYPIRLFYRGSIPELTTSNTKSMDPIITQTAILNTSAEKAFKMFTENELLESWLTIKADVNPEPGGKYELFWEPDDPENNSTIGCKILAIESPQFINFEWKGPKQYKHFMNDAQPLTNVAVTFMPIENGTRVTLIHTGWRDSGNWEEARQYFINAWQGAFTQLEKVVNTTEAKMDENEQAMESNILGLRTAIYKVSDLNAAKEWYTNVFQNEPYFDESYYVGYNIGGFELGLLPNRISALDKSEGVVAYWGVDDIESEYNQIIDLGAIAHEPPKNVGGEIMVATMKDPWGNVIGLIYNPEFKIGSE